jgi:hypothetical protein
LVLSVAMACWHGEHGGELPFGWLRNDPVWCAQVLGQRSEPVPEETDEERAARRMAARGWPPNPWLPERHG